MNRSHRKKHSLRTGFSTGTAATAAARAALRLWLTGNSPGVIAVRLPGGSFLPVDVRDSQLDDEGAWARVIKDGGDDPDVTHKAEIVARVRCFGRCSRDGRSTLSRDGAEESGCQPPCGICLIGGDGVGVVTKPGLPVRIGEPAVNPVPRQMLVRNVTEELRVWSPVKESAVRGGETWRPPSRPHVFLPLIGGGGHVDEVLIEVEIEVPKGAELAGHTLNPRLGILGGLSILGTTGIVKPFSHEAYQETIHSALSVAFSGGCRQVVLSTGGKSEKYARQILPDLPDEAFVQVADFYAFSLGESLMMGFEEMIHSVFFGKLIKMAQGHACTHAHKASLELGWLAALAERQAHDETFCRELAMANTARHALELILARKSSGLIDAVAREALAQSGRVVEGRARIRVLLFAYDGTLLADLKT